MRASQATFRIGAFIRHAGGLFQVEGKRQGTELMWSNLCLQMSPQATARRAVMKGGTGTALSEDRNVCFGLEVEGQLPKKEETGVMSIHTCMKVSQSFDTCVLSTNYVPTLCAERGYQHESEQRSHCPQVSNKGRDSSFPSASGRASSSDKCLGSFDNQLARLSGEKEKTNQSHLEISKRKPITPS